ncbi:MAG: PQQ-dependent sugar dehydrogenase [Myxococcota bacterium]|nr:PQQ-dependent sugar dehydrogenase [Myxococcota bacterium]
MGCAEAEDPLMPGSLDTEQLGDSSMGPMDSSARAGRADNLGTSAYQPRSPGPDAVVEPYEPPIENPYEPRIGEQTCIIPPAPQLGRFTLVPTYPDQRFNRPVWYGTAPGEPAVAYVVEQGRRNERLGRVLRLVAGQPMSVFYERTVHRGNNEEGLLGLAFHPNFRDNGRFFIHYSGPPANRGQSTSPNNPTPTYVAEVRRDPNHPEVALPNSEKIILEIPQPFGNHNGGDLKFGPDGYLYISVGDGGRAGDPLNSGQDTTNLLGAILRIDVDQADQNCGRPYAIPEGNPFAQTSCHTDGAPSNRPELWAWGLRNVWRMSFDRATGALWAADVGQNEWEEINIIRGGHNYGWKPMEGNHCFVDPCSPALYAPPVYVYGHDEGDKSVTGGVVYRGAQFPELWGHYVFGDFESGRIWALDPNAPEDGAQLLTDSNHQISSFGEDENGEIYVVTFTGGILSFVAQNQSSMTEGIPEQLSKTGCFTDTATHLLAKSVTPYDVQVPFWSDGLIKKRYFALPANQKMAFRSDSAYELPIGSVVLKSMIKQLPDGTEQRVETRVIRRDVRGWNGYTYVWRDDQSDADLAQGRVELTLGDGPSAQRWTVPSRADCDQCHVHRTGYVLGLSTHQLNHAITMAGQSVEQLDALASGGFIDLPRPASELPSFSALDDETRAVEARARAMLDTNCAMCHQPDGPADAEIDLRFQTPIAQMNACGEVPKRGDLERPDDLLIFPGASEKSILVHRMILKGKKQMPPLGTRMVDTAGIDILKRWIDALSSCP